MLEVQKLSKSYGKSLAVDEVSFFVPDGTVGILLGPNGAGKSTIIKSIAGLLRYQGRIGIQGLPARSVGQRDSLPMFRRCLPCLMHSASENTSNT